MKADSDSLSILNGVLRDQLTAINQFFLHARMLKNWGLHGLNEASYRQSIRAMKRADDLVERVLFLEGLPNLQDLGKLLIGEDVPEILQNDLAFEMDARGRLQQSIAALEDSRDFVSRELLEKILSDTEEHIDWIESQQWLIANSGLENYIQSNI